jgi:hypothetical protein
MLKIDIETIIKKLQIIETDIKNINNDLDKIISDDKQKVKIMNEKFDKIMFLLDTSKKRINNNYSDNIIEPGYNYFD